MKRISKDEMFTCALVSEFPYSKVSDVIKEACEHQLEADLKELDAVVKKIKMGVAKAIWKSYYIAPDNKPKVINGLNQALKKYGGIK